MMAPIPADRLIMAQISGITSRATARHVLADDDRQSAVDALRQVAGHRPDLLAEHAGVCLGIAQAGLPLLAPAYRLSAELANRGRSRRGTDTALDGGGDLAGRIGSGKDHPDIG